MRTCRTLIVALALLAGAVASAPAQDPAAPAPAPSQPAPAPGGSIAVPAANPTQHATFRVFLRGGQVGTEEIDVTRDGDQWLISGTSSLGAPVAFNLRRGEIRYTADWQPLSIVLEGAIRGEPLQLRTTFRDGQAVNEVLDRGQTVEKTDPVSPATVALPNNFFAAYTGLAVRLASATPGTEVRAYVAPQAEIPVTLRSVATQRMQTANRAFEVRQYRISIQNPGASLDAEVWAEPDGRLVRFSLPSVSLDVVREDVASVAARTQSFHRENDADVRIPTTGFSLAGTISRPPGTTAPSTDRRTPPPPRLPAIVLVAGSGPLDRDEVVAGIPIFGQLAGALADAGFLVVRYDKRGVGQSGGRMESATLQDYAEDLRAVVRYLADRKDVDPKRIAVVGHSEGAWVAMLTASREKRISKLVLIAAPATTGAQLVLEQQRHVLERSSLPEAERQEKTALQQRIHDAVLSGGSWDGIPDALRKQADTPWFASLLAYDPGRVMPRVSQPVLIVQPELDKQVVPEHARRLAELAKSRKRNPGVEVVTIPGANHLLVQARTGEVDEYGSLDSREIAPGVADALVKWLQSPPQAASDRQAASLRRGRRAAGDHS